MDFLEQVDQLDSRVLKAYKEIQDHKVLPATPELRVQLDNKVPPDLKEHKDPLEVLVPPVSRDLKVIRVSLDKLELLESQELKAFRVQLVIRD